MHSAAQDCTLMEDGAENSRYQKRRGFASTSGQDYEVTLCCLLFLRSLRLTSEFFLACNHDHAGTFDDVVIFYRLKGEQGFKYRAIFLQAKHKENRTEKKLTLSNPFSLARYLESFKKIRGLWEQSVNIRCRQIQLQEISLVLYTNTGCAFGDTALDVTDFPEMETLQSFLNTGGRLLRISQAQRAGLPEGPDTSDFLSHLLLCTGQMGIETADHFLEDELQQVLRLRSQDVARNLNSELKRVLKGWWREEGDMRYLTAQSKEWKNVLEMQVMRWRSDTVNFVSQLNLNYTVEAVEELKSVICHTKKSWIFVRDEYQATVTRDRLLKALRNCLILNDSDHVEEVEVLWGTVVCPALVLDISVNTPDKSSLLERLQKAVDSKPGRVLVVIAMEQPTSTEWTAVKVGKTWSFLDHFTRDRLLSVHIMFQGYDVTLRDVIGSNVAGIESDEIIILLCDPGKEIINLGESIPSTLEYYVPRCLQRTSTKIFNYDSLQNTNTLIFSKNLFIPKVTFVNKLKIIWPSDLKRTNEMKGTLFVKGLSLDSEIRKLCCKLHFCGISGEIGQDNLEGNLTEFVPFTWICQEKVIVIDGVPGVGKSSFVTAMCSSVKKKFPDSCVLRLDMGRHSEFIKKSNFQKDSDVKEFLLTGLSKAPQSLERNLFEHSLYVTGNVFLFLDAFDEISPDYTVKCCDLLKRISQTVTFRQMVVTTRPVTTKVVEDVLETKAFTLPVFTEEEQTLLIKRFTEVGGMFAVDGNIFTLRQSIGTVLEIPLLCKMAAEVLLYYHDDKFTEGVDPWRKILLYKLFVNKSVEERLIDKFGLEPTMPGMKKILESSRNHHLQNLQELAVKKLLPVNELSTFNFSTEMPEEKFGLVVNTGERVEFVHQTFAEYFVGCWLAVHWKECPQRLIQDVFLQYEYDLVAATLNWSLLEGFPLHEAVALGDTLAVQKFLSLGTTDRGGRSPLHVAAMTRGEHRQLWEILVADGEDLNKKDDILHSTSATYAEMYRNWEMVDYLLQKGAAPDELKFFSNESNAKDVLRCIIHYDIGSLCRHILRLHRRLIHVPFDGEGNSALHLAAAHDSLEITKVLLEMRHPVNVKNIFGNTPLHDTSGMGLEEAVRLLLEKGADPNVKNNNDRTALVLAALNGRVATARLLLEHGADPGTKNDRGNSALSMASLYGNWETVRLLIENKTDPDVMRDTVNRALLLAALFGHLETVRLVLAKGADVNTYDEYGSALIQAAWNGHVRMTRLLLEHGADPNAKNNAGQSALFMASMNGHLDIVKLLTDNGAEPNVKDNGGDTALMVAAKKGHKEIVEYLLSNGADPNVADAQRKTVFQICSSEILKCLRIDCSNEGGDKT